MTKDNNVHLWRWRVVLIVLMIGVLLVSGLARMYHNGQQRQRHHAERELQVISQLQGLSLLAWREQRLTDAAVLSDDAMLGRHAARWLSLEFPELSVLPGEGADLTTGDSIQHGLAIQQEQGVLQAQLQRELRILQEQKNYSAVYLVDVDARVRLSPNGIADRLLPQAERAALREALEYAQPVVVEPRRDATFGFPFFSVLAPIYDGMQAVGAVWLVMDVRASLYPLLERWPSGSATAESAIVMRDGDEALVLSPLRHQQEMTLPYRVSLQDSLDPVVQTVMGMRGVFYSRDYRSEPVIAVANTVPGSPWYLLSKVDTKEALASEWRELLTLGVSAFLGLLGIGLFLIYLQRQAWRRERALKLELERTLRWLENAQKTASVGYFAYSLDSRVFAVSDTTRTIFGLLSEQDMTLERWLDSVHPEDREHVLDAYRQVIAQHKPLRIQHRIRRETDHQERWVETWGEYETDALSMGGVRLIGTMQDITDSKQIEKELEQAKTALEEQVRLDSLTQIANRRALDERLLAEWGRAARHNHPLSLLMIDVDHFKHFNDYYGHVAGDHCLQRVVQVISSVVMRSSDLLARYGGEEFVVLLPDTDEGQAYQMAERICAAIRKEAIEHVYVLPLDVVTVSVGVVCVSPARDADVTRGMRVLLERADTALYMAKHAGRDGVAVYRNQHTDTVITKISADAGTA